MLLPSFLRKKFFTYISGIRTSQNPSRRTTPNGTDTKWEKILRVASFYYGESLRLTQRFVSKLRKSCSGMQLYNVVLVHHRIMRNAPVLAQL